MDDKIFLVVAAIKQEIKEFKEALKIISGDEIKGWNDDEVETTQKYCSNWTCQKKTTHTKYYVKNTSYWACNICGTKN